jgi:hypothetical protein
VSLLSALIQKRESRKAATAIPAIPATQPREEAATVARIATVAVANPTEAKTANAAKSWGWRVHFADRDPVEVYCNPDADFANIMQTYPDALAAEPIPERIPKVFTEAEDAEWEALWLGVPDNDRITCTQCANLRGRVCTVAGGLVNALKGYTPILEILRRCEGYAPLKTTMEQRVSSLRTGTNQVTTND